VSRSPRFRELVDPDGLGFQERARLRRVHDLLVAAGPPADVPSRLHQAPGAPHGRRLRLPRRRHAGTLLLAAALAAAAFAGGYALAPHSGSPTSGSRWHGPIAMRGPSGTLAMLRVTPADPAGNRRVRLSVHGLPRLPAGGYYELLLTRNGHAGPECGRFAVGPGTTEVTMNIPYRLQRWNGWVIVRHLPRRPESAPLLST
jgi:hypothetical protein